MLGGDETGTHLNLTPQPGSALGSAAVSTHITLSTLSLTRPVKAGPHFPPGAGGLLRTGGSFPLGPEHSRAAAMALTSILVWIQGPTMLAWLANWRRRCSLDCCLLCSSRRAWSRLGTSCCTWGRGPIKSSQGGGPLTWRPALSRPSLPTGTAHLLPLGVDNLGGDGGVGIAA